MNTKNSFLRRIILLSVFIGCAAHAQTQSVSTKAEAEDTEIQESQQEADSKDVQQEQELKIDEDELPGESVTPRTDIVTSVVNKKIKFAKRFMVDLYGGSILDEPLVNSGYFTARVSYFSTEEYSFGAGFRSRFGGKSNYSQQLYDGSGKLDFDLAPSPAQSHFVSFGYVFYYGKMSFGKTAVIPATTRLETDFGMQKYGSADKPFIQAAVNQSFYITRHIAMGLSFGLSLAQGYDPTSIGVRMGTNPSPVPKESDFTEKILFNQYLGVNLSTLF